MKFGINFIDNTTFSTIRVCLHNLTEDLLSELFTFNHTLTRGELSVQQSSKMNCGSTFNVRGILSSQELSEFIKLKERINLNSKITRLNNKLTEAQQKELMLERVEREGEYLKAY
jgi:hypothetical protein